jgi:hypothetical protein
MAGRGAGMLRGILRLRAECSTIRHFGLLLKAALAKLNALTCIPERVFAKLNYLSSGLLKFKTITRTITRSFCGSVRIAQ